MDRHEHEIQSEEYREFLNDPGWHRWQAKRLREEAAQHERIAQELEHVGQTQRTVSAR